MSLDNSVLSVYVPAFAPRKIYNTAFTQPIWILIWLCCHRNQQQVLYKREEFVQVVELHKAVSEAKHHASKEFCFVKHTCKQRQISHASLHFHIPRVARGLVPASRASEKSKDAPPTSSATDREKNHSSFGFERELFSPPGWLVRPHKSRMEALSLGDLFPLLGVSCPASQTTHGGTALCIPYW